MLMTASANDRAVLVWGRSHTRDLDRDPGPEARMGVRVDADSVMHPGPERHPRSRAIAEGMAS